MESGSSGTLGLWRIESTSHKENGLLEHSCLSVFSMLICLHYTTILINQLRTRAHHKISKLYLENHRLKNVLSRKIIRWNNQWIFFKPSSMCRAITNERKLNNWMIRIEIPSGIDTCIQLYIGIIDIHDRSIHDWSPIKSFTQDTLNFGFLNI